MKIYDCYWMALVISMLVHWFRTQHLTMSQVKVVTNYWNSNVGSGASWKRWAMSNGRIWWVFFSSVFLSSKLDSFLFCLYFDKTWCDYVMVVRTVFLFEFIAFNLPNIQKNINLVHDSFELKLFKPRQTVGCLLVFTNTTMTRRIKLNKKTFFSH